MRDRLRKTAGDVKCKVLNEIAHADGGDHQRHTRRLAQRLIGHALDHKAEHDRQDQHQRKRYVHGHRCAGIDHDKTRHHENIAVGEVDQAQNAVHQRIADRDQRILTAGSDAVDKIR